MVKNLAINELLELDDGIVDPDFDDSVKGYPEQWRGFPPLTVYGLVSTQC
jgi:hypothetical protein